MSDEKIPNPHDRTFRRIFEVPKHAAALFRAHLPTRYRSLLDLDSLEVLSPNVIDDDLTETNNDLIFRTSLADHDAWIFLVLEHQSTQTRWIVLRFLIYVARLMQKFAPSEQDAKLPLPILVVVNQGPGHWTAPTSLEDQVEVPQGAEVLLEMAPQFRYHAIDLPRLTETSLADDPTVALTLSLMKAVATRRLVPWLQEHLNEITEAWEENESTVNTLFSYMQHTDSELTRDDIAGLSQRVQNGSLSKTIMTLADRLLEEGEARGEARGAMLGRIDAVAHYFTGQFGDLGWHARLEKLDPKACEELIDQFWKFPDADAVLVWLKNQ